MQTNHYYPYGLSFADGLQTSTQPYKYNGKEFDGEDGLNLYDYVARLMDPMLGGRFQTIDPLAEKNPGVSPYAYCLNNPLKFIDPDGRREWPVNATYKGQARSHLNNYGEPRENGRKHKGIDINLGTTDLGAPVYATHDGKVTRVVTINSGDKDGGGNRVQIESEGGEVSTYYMHLNSIDSSVGEGKFISEGTQIGTIGGSGKGVANRYAPHLHYEMTVDGQQTNPATSATGLMDPQMLINPQDGGIITPVVVTGQSASRTILGSGIKPVVFDRNTIK